MVSEVWNTDENYENYVQFMKDEWPDLLPSSHDQWVAFNQAMDAIENPHPVYWWRELNGPDPI